MPGERPKLISASDISEAVGLLTRLPARPAVAPRGGRAAWAWPLTGIAVGLIGATAGWLALALWLPPALAAGIALAAEVLASGALHEDGLADTADGLWGGASPERRLEIMRDSRIGSYGVIALMIGFGLRWTALTALISAHHLFPVLIGVGLISRAPMAVIMAALPPARTGGLSASVGRPGQDTATLAVALALGLGVLVVGWVALAAAFWAALASLGLGALAKARIGGQTGDILGAAQQLSEIAALMTLAALL